jgi:hypothetical protein
MAEYHAGTEWEDTWDMDDNAINSLLPNLIISAFSTVVSLVGFVVWLFFSPHLVSAEAEGLDRKCRSAWISFSICVLAVLKFEM